MRVHSRRSLLVAPFHPDLFDACRDLVASWDAAVVVVPRSLLGRHLRRAARDRSVPRTMTWMELALALTAPEREVAGRGTLVTEAAAWIVRGLRLHRERTRTVYDGVLSERGFRVELQRAFEDLARAGLASCSEAERFLVQHAAELPLALRHVLELYLTYRRGFEPTHEDTAAALRAAARAARAGSAGRVLRARHLIFYGRSELDAVEMELVAALAADRDLGLAFLAPPAPGDATALPAQFAALGFEVESRAPSVLRAALAGLSAPSQESEGVEVARRILVAAEAGIAFNEMAVVARTPVRLEPVARALARAGVPHARATGTPVATTRAGRSVLAFLDLVESDEPLDPALLFLEIAPLAPGALGLDAEAVPSAWERVAREARLGRAPGAWDTRLARFAAAASRRAARAHAAGEPAARAEAAALAAASLRTTWTALRTELGAIPARATWAESIVALRGIVERLFVADAERDAVVAALDGLQTLAAFGDGRVPRAEFHAAVRAALAEAQRVIEPEGVLLGSASTLHGCDYRLVCIVGLEEGEWPASPADDPVLPDAARVRLASLLPASGAALQPRIFARARERRLATDAATAAREQLILSWTRLDAQTGATRSPSALVHEIAALRPDPADTTWIERVPLRRRTLPPDFPVLDLTELDEIAVASLPPRAARAYVRMLASAASRGLVIEALRARRSRFTVADGMLATPASRTALTARVENVPLSATLLRDYLACPFRSFMRHLLRLESLEPEVDRVPSALAVGRLAHRILEMFYRELERDGATLAALDDSALRARVDRAARAARDTALAQGDIGRGLPWEVQWTILVEDLRHYLRRERTRGDASWVATAFEARFGPGTDRASAVLLPQGGTIALRGTMDRLDARRSGPGWRVVDYKTGREPRDAPHAGLQLAVYLHVATGGDAALLGRSVAEFAYVTRRGRHAIRTLSGDVLAADPEAFTRLVEGVAQGMRAGAFFPQPGPKGEECENCAYTPVCDARVVLQAAIKQRAGQGRWLEGLPRFETHPEGGA